MIRLFRRAKIFAHTPQIICEDNSRQILVFRRGDYVFAFNFNPVESFPDYRFLSLPVSTV